MKPYLVDVPVRINIWIRPECQKQQWEVIKQARPSILFIQSDGGRNEREWEAIYANRQMIDGSIDWDCTVYRLYEEKNNGLYAMAHKTYDLIWNTVDRCIMLEDDHIPAVSFFRYCSELLERYKDDERIECICGFNNLGTWDKCSSDYFFSRQGAIWGIATWKRVVEEFYDFSYGKDEYVMGLLKQRTKHNRIAWKRLCAYAKSDMYEGHIAGTEFFYEFFMYSQNRLQIVPKRNMITNIGAGANATHSDELKQLPKGIRRLYNSPKYESNFPIKHPRYVIPDIEYEKKRNKVMAYNYPMIKICRDIERALRKMCSGDFWYVVKKINMRFMKLIGKNNET